MENFESKNEAVDFQKLRTDLQEKAVSANFEQDVISIASEIIELDLRAGVTPVVFI